MNSIKILHCADIHIGAAENFLGSNANKRRFETLFTFERIIECAKKSDVRLFLIAGDLFDSNKIEDVFVERVFSAIESAKDVEFVFCAGNHDPLDSTSPFVTRTLPRNLHVLKTEEDCVTFDALSTRVYGRSFKEVYMRGQPYFPLIPPKDDYVNIMCIHGELRADLGSDYNSITPGFIKSSGMDYIALGHVHKRTGIARVGKSFCAYCGCPEGQGFDELDEKGVYIGEVSKENCALDFVPVSNRLHICETVDVSSVTHSSEIAGLIINTLMQKYGEDYGRNLYKIILTGQLDEEIEVSVDEICGRVANEVFFVKIKDKTEIKIDLQALSNETSLKGVFVKNMLEAIENAPEDKKSTFKYALQLGLRAFRSEVAYNED